MPTGFVKKGQMNGGINEATPAAYRSCQLLQACNYRNVARRLRAVKIGFIVKEIWAYGEVLMGRIETEPIAVCSINAFVPKRT